VCAAIHAALTVGMGAWTAKNPMTLVLQSLKVGAALNAAGGDADLAGLATDLPPLNVATFRERISGGTNQGRS
jgi:hypothetical protein